MTSDQYTELVAFVAQKFDEQWRRTLALMEQARDERRILAEGMDVRFAKVDERFDQMDGRLDAMDEGFGGRLRSLEEWVRRVGTDHERRIRALE